MIILIQGFFFQERPGYGISYNEGDARVFVRNIALRTMFSGMFGLDEAGSTLMVGGMTDYFGESELTGIEFDADNLRFTKKYLNRSDLIQYQFKKYIDGTWHGTYRGIATDTGQACCIITTVPDGFLLPKADMNHTLEESPRRPVKKGGSRKSSLETYRR